MIVFFGLYQGIINNFKFSRFVRFNGMQAVLLSIIQMYASYQWKLYCNPGACHFTEHSYLCSREHRMLIAYTPCWLPTS